MTEPSVNPDSSMKKIVKILPYIGVACALLSVIILPFFFSIIAVIFGVYSYFKGEKKGIISALWI
jgi:hypothetical protein